MKRFLVPRVAHCEGGAQLHLAAAVMAGEPPGLALPKAGRFRPGQPGDWPLVPGYSCRHCGCLVVRRHLGALSFTVHAWNRSVFCDLLRGGLRLAEPYEGE